MSPRELISAKPITVDGIRYKTRTEAYRKYGVSTPTVWRRMQRGMSLEEAIKTKPVKGSAGIPRKIELCGEWYRSINHAANSLGIKPDTAKRRLHLGWSLYQAFGLADPPQQSKRTLKIATYQQENETGVRTCRTCNKIKSLRSFPAQAECISGRSRECRACKTNRSRLRRYGISESEYYDLLKKQDNKCAICSLPYFCRTTKRLAESNEFKLAVDHCHKTGKVRGLLCYQCNVGLGKFSDDLDLLRKAVQYLEAHACK